MFSFLNKFSRPINYRKSVNIKYKILLTNYTKLLYFLFLFYFYTFLYVFLNILGLCWICHILKVKWELLILLYYVVRFFCLNLKILIYTEPILIMICLILIVIIPYGPRGPLKECRIVSRITRFILQLYVFLVFL